MTWGKLRACDAGKHICAALVGAAAVLGSAGTVSPALAQGTSGNKSSAAAIAFSIPAGPLSQAIVSFSAASGINIVSSGVIPPGAQTSGVSGTFSPSQALAKLLAGTGYTYRFSSANSVTIIDPGANAAGATVEGAIALDTIDVSGGGGAEAAADLPYQTPGSSSFISAQQIERFPGTSSGDVFKSTPGVIAAMNHNGSSMDVNIRGLQGMNRVKVTIDGTQQTTSTWRGYLGADDRTYVDPDLIASIGIEKGPTSGAAGAGVNGGVVSFRTLEAQDIILPGNTEGVRLRMGTSDNATSDIRIDAYNQSTDAPNFFDLENKSGSAAFALTRENFDVVAAVTKRQTGNYFAGKEGPTKHPKSNYNLSYTKPGEEVFNSSADTFSALGKVTLRLDDEQTLQFGYTRYESEFGETIGSLLTTGDSSFRQLPLANAAVDTYTARYRWNPASELIDIRFNAWATDVKATTLSVGPAPNIPSRPLAHDTRFSETWTYGTDITNTSKFANVAGAFKFDYGASYTLEDTNGKPYISGRQFSNLPGVPLRQSTGTREIGSVFSNGEWEPTSWLKFNAGLRYDGFSIDERGGPVTSLGTNYVAVFADKSGGRLNPTAGVTLTPLDGLQFYALYAEGFRPPSLRETIGSDSGLAPNPELEPETAKNWEFGINYLKDGLVARDDKVRMKAAYFINNYDNYISRVPNPKPANGAPVFSVANIPQAMFKGFELSGSYSMGYFFAEAALTYYTDFEFCSASGTCASSSLTNDYAVNQLPPKLSKSLTLGVRLLDDTLTVGTRITSVGNRLGPLPSSWQQTNFWLPYTVYDGFVTYKVSDNLQLDLNGENLFDRYYVDALDGWMPAPGRTIRAGATMRY